MHRVNPQSPHMVPKIQGPRPPVSSGGSDMNRLAELVRCSAAMEVYQEYPSASHLAKTSERLLEKRDDVAFPPYPAQDRQFRSQVSNPHGWKASTSSRNREHVHDGHYLNGRGASSLDYSRRQYLAHGAVYDGNLVGMQRSAGMVPLSSEERRLLPTWGYSASTSSHIKDSSGLDYSRLVATKSVEQGKCPREYHMPHQNLTGRSRVYTSSSRGGHSSITTRSRIVIPSNLVIPKEISSLRSDSSVSPTDTEGGYSTGTGKRSLESEDGSSASPDSSMPKQKKPSINRDEGFDKLNLLCSATLNLGPLQTNPTGCSCPKSKCVALYCDCFKAGIRCDPKACSCVDCKNTISESGKDGARTKAIQSILARNPRAFTMAGAGNPNSKLPPGEQGCNCVRSRCLKLYCTCFQDNKVCDPGICLCVGCLNTLDDTSGQRKEAIEATLEKRPDAFAEKKKVKEIGSGCACKNNKCIRKYCECFRTNLKCTSRCSCRDCKNP